MYCCPYIFLLCFVLNFSGHISTVVFSSILTGIIPMFHYHNFIFGFLIIFDLLFGFLLKNKSFSYFSVIFFGFSVLLVWFLDYFVTFGME